MSQPYHYQKNAFEAGNCCAGLQLADNFWQGKGVTPNRDKAVEIYQNVCENQPELLTAAALNHMIEAKLIEFIPKYEGFVATVAKLVDLKETNATQPSQKLISSLKDSLNTSMLSLFSKDDKNNPLNIKFDPRAKITELEKSADQIAEQLIASIEPILSLPIADLPQFKQHSLWVTAHMLMLRVLIEQKDLIANTPQWTTAFKRSLRCAWEYDALPDADEELVTMLKRVKEMHKGTSYEMAIGSIRLDQHLARRDARFFNGDNRQGQPEHPKQAEKPIARSASMPNLFNPSHGLKGW